MIDYLIAALLMLSIVAVAMGIAIGVGAAFL